MTRWRKAFGNLWDSLINNKQNQYEKLTKGRMRRIVFIFMLAVGCAAPAALHAAQQERRGCWSRLWHTYQNWGLRIQEWYTLYTEADMMELSEARQQNELRTRLRALGIVGRDAKS